jgi:hypothetical protein
MLVLSDGQRTPVAFPYFPAAGPAKHIGASEVERRVLFQSDFGQILAGVGSSGRRRTGGRRSAEFPAFGPADNSGNVYLSDEYNWAVRLVAPNGIITTFAGNGQVPRPVEPATADRPLAPNWTSRRDWADGPALSSPFAALLLPVLLGDFFPQR